VGNTQDKKDRVLHTRVPEVLDEELRDRAKRLGLSVSTLVRNILGNTLGLVEDVVVDSANIAQSVAGHPPLPSSRMEVPPQQPLPQLVGWQQVVLHINAICDVTNAILPRGSRAWIGVHHPPRTGRPLIVSQAGLDQLVPTHPHDVTRAGQSASVAQEHRDD